jgi:hypothetical protein
MRPGFEGKYARTLFASSPQQIPTYYGAVHRIDKSHQNQTKQLARVQGASQGNNSYYLLAILISQGTPPPPETVGGVSIPP